MDTKGLENLKNSSLKKMDDFLSNLISSGDDKNIKKARLLSYWLKSYVNFLKKEETFSPDKLIKYNRGDIVKIDLGFNVGSEEGGLHYAVVIDNNNSKYNNTITIVPLSSIRTGRKIHHSSVELGNEIFKSVVSKHDKLLHTIKKELSELQSNINELKPKLNVPEIDPSSRDKLYNLTMQVEKLNAKESELDGLMQEIKRMKAGSVALVGQITTISKMRIYDPLYTNSVLKGIRLPAEQIELINEKLKSLFIYEK